MTSDSITFLEVNDLNNEVFLAINRIRCLWKQRADTNSIFKVGLSPSHLCFICFNESPLKMMKRGFYFFLKAHFALKIFYAFVILKKRLD